MSLIRAFALNRLLLRRIVALLIIVWLAGCSREVREQPQSPAYVPGTVYYQLLAEIALERKSYLVAAEEYLNAALQSTDPALVRRATRFAFDYGYESYALSAVQRWLELEPKNRLAHEYAGRLYVRRHDTDSAYIHWRVQLGNNPDVADFQDVAARLAEEENAAVVTTLLKQLSREYPAEPQLQFDLASAALNSAHADLALHAASTAVQLDPSNEAAQLLLAQALAAAGYEAQAFSLLEELLAEGGSVMVAIEYVQLLAAVDSMTEANERLQVLSLSLGQPPDLLRMHALLNFAASDWAVAAESFAKLLQSGNNIYESYYYLGRIAWIEGDVATASENFARVGGGRYQLPATVSLSAVLQDAGEYAEAEQILRDFSAAYPRLALKVAPALAQLLFEQGQTDAALDIMAQTLLLQPDSLSLLLGYGAMLDQAGQTERALDILERAVTIAPLNANALNALGYTLVNNSLRKREAYAMIRAALELSPNDPAIIDSMGWALFRLGRELEARSYLELANSRLNDPEIMAHLGEVLWVTGEREQARALVEQGLREFPDNAVLQSVDDRVIR